MGESPGRIHSEMFARSPTSRLFISRTVSSHEVWTLFGPYAPDRISRWGPDPNEESIGYLRSDWHQDSRVAHHSEGHGNQPERTGAGGQDHCQHRIPIYPDGKLPPTNLRLPTLRSWLDSSAYRWLCSFPGAQPASRTSAIISATADLDDRDLEEVTLYARFRRAQRAKRRA